MKSMEIAESFIELDPRTLTLTSDHSGLERLSKAINSETRRKIIQLLSKEPMDISRLSSELQQTEANISAQIKIIETAGLISSLFRPGEHGIRKICNLKYNRIVIHLE